MADACTECGTDPKVCAHLVASKGMAGCCGACSTGSTHSGVAAGPQATPQVLWEGPIEEFEKWLGTPTDHPRGMGVRVIAAPGDPATNRDETASNLTDDGGFG